MASREHASRQVTHDPHGALAAAMSLDAGPERDALVRDLLAAWALRDGGAALGWADAQEDPAVRRAMRSTICLAIAGGDPRHAIELALAHGADEEGDGLLECLTMQWSECEPGAALEWVKSQPAGEWRGRLMARAAFVLSKSDPRSAACHVAEEMDAGPAQTEAILSVVHQWATTDPAAAAEWAQGFPAGELRDRAMGELEGSTPVP